MVEVCDKAYVISGACLSKIDIFNLCASTASIIGLIISVFLLFEAKEIRRLFLQKARLPEIIEDLQQSYLDLSKNLQSKNLEECYKTLKNSTPLIKGLKEKLPKRNNLSKEIKYYEDNFPSEANADIKEYWECSVALSTLIVSLQEIDKDSKWG